MVEKAEFQRFCSRKELNVQTKVILPENLRDKVQNFGEYSMGANKVAVVLKDGRVVEDVFVAWASEVVKVGGSTKIPFKAEDIVDVINRA